MAGPQKAAQVGSCVTPKLAWSNSKAVKDITSNGSDKPNVSYKWKSFTKY